MSLTPYDTATIKPQTKGYQKDARITIEDVEKLFAETGTAKYVKICKAGGNKLSECGNVAGTAAVAASAIVQQPYIVEVFYTPRSARPVAANSVSVIM